MIVPNIQNDPSDLKHGPLSHNSLSDTSYINSNFSISPSVINNSRLNISGPSFSIATHNVRGLMSLTKQQQVLSYMQDNNFDVLGISESKLSSAASKNIFQGNTEYTSWWNCLDSNHTSAGVGLIFHSSVACYVQLIRDYKGRVIYANLFLRGNIKIRLIQVYVQAHISNKVARLDIDNFILSSITSALQQSFHVIVMGILTSTQIHYKNFV